MTRRRIIYLLTLIGSIVFYLFYQQWTAWVLLLVIAFLPWLSLLLSLAAMLRLRMELNVASRVSMGDIEKVKLKVSSKLPLPPYKSKLRITKPLTGESWVLRSGAKLPTEHCGKLRIQLHKPRVADFLGILAWKVRNTDEKNVLIMPKPVKLEIPPDLYKHLEPRWRRKAGGGFAENYEIRQYYPGDSLNRIHWKLSAKVGELILREPMEPERGLMLLTMDLKGTAPVLDKKLGQLLWLGQWLLEREITFDIRVLTAKETKGWTIRNEFDLTQCIITLLGTPFAREGSIRDQFFKATWRYHIGGEQREE